MDPKQLESRRAELEAQLATASEIEDAEERSAALDVITADLDTLEEDQKRYDAEVAKAAEIRARLASSTKARQSVEKEERKEEADEVIDIRSMAERFSQSSDLRAYQEHRIGSGGGSRMEFEGTEIRALIGSGPVAGAVTSSAGVLSPVTRRPGAVNVVEDRPLALADLMNVVPVSGNAVEYVRDNSPAPNGAAAVVAEGAAKPESTYTWELVSDTIKTVATWTDVSRQAVADQAQLTGILRGRLFYSLRYRLDSDIIAGTGTSGTIKGLSTYAGINSYDVGSTNTEAKILSLRKAKTLVRKDEFAANVAVLNPDDWETIELSTDSNGAWRVTPNVQENLTPRIWGMRVVETNAIAAGKAFIGDFRLGAELYDRQQASLYVTDSDADKFRSNILTMLAEYRLALAMLRPSAFALITFRGAA